MNVGFDHPANAQVLAWLQSQPSNARPENRSAPSSIYDLHHNALGTHPDLADRLWKELTVSLPEPCGWVVYGRPVLVCPSTGVLFGWAGGTHDYALRLPEAERARALAAGAKPAPDLGEEWVLGRWLADEPRWCLAAYELASRSPG